MQIGERLFSLRKKNGETLQQVADAVGVSKAHVWELEKGHSQNPSFDLVRRLANHFGVGMEVLAGDADEPDAGTLQVERIHRGLEDLTDRDRQVVEHMIETLRQSAPSKS